MESNPSPPPNLDDLLAIFYGPPHEFPLDRLGRFFAVTGPETPQPFRQLLDHEHHMTVTVEAFHQGPVDVRVLAAKRTDEDHYCRRILLTRRADGAVVMFGVVRLRLSVLDPQVRAEIESERTPLGRILIEHQVLREIELHQLYRVACGPELAELLNVPLGSDVFGRTALIYCNPQPAVELLEIVPPLPPPGCT